MSHSMADQETQVTRLRLTVARLYRQMAQASHGQDLTFAQLSALARIEEHGPLRLGELAARESVAAPSMTRTLTALSYGGLIEREADPSDGRSSLVSATAKGRELMLRVRRERSELLADRVAELSGEQRETLWSALGVLELLLDRPALD
ncbi:MarR family winged helix-turn-helix transcriptional regulator [Streptacidiphilus cavernicola]|uniref:MarR family winged helix-turn-helix transcriptional regulator n=1 Tax=Streptacidiphilus cavernicola TaxID=3342716 RepID=A0ABV6W4I8_9ACTN